MLTPGGYYIYSDMSIEDDTMTGRGKEVFFRVQSIGRDAKSGTFQTRKTPSGGKVVSIRKDTYISAKKAAAKAMKSKQPV